MSNYNIPPRSQIVIPRSTFLLRRRSPALGRSGRSRLLEKLEPFYLEILEVASCLLLAEEREVGE
jgi:hypothetical protein